MINLGKKGLIKFSSGEMNMTEQILTALDMAGLLKVPRDQIYALVKAGRIPAPQRLGKRRWRWPAGKVMEWINGGMSPQELVQKAGVR